MADPVDITPEAAEEDETMQAPDSIPVCDRTDDSPPPWPEQALTAVPSCSWLSTIYERWSYSYMNVILAKGQRQFKDGEHLEQKDLYAVPPDMDAGYLVQEFWYDLSR